MHDTEGLEQVVQLMLGELNGSHLGFYAKESSREKPVRMERRHGPSWCSVQGRLPRPGLKVRDVLRNGPADRAESRLKAGDVIVAIDGTAVDPAMDLTKLLNGRLDRNIELRIKRNEERNEKAADEEDEIDISIRPISYSAARSLLYEHWLDNNRSIVEKAGKGKLGYLHIHAMNMSSFYEFERQLYNVGYGREGLVIDVRDCLLAENQ